MRQTERLNRIRYRLYAPVYDLVAKPLQRGRQRAIERLELDEDDRILILGAGPGVDLEYLPEAASVTAVDITPAMVRRAESRGERLGLDLDARVGDATALSLPDDSFDAVLLHLVLSVVADPDAVVEEAERVLGPDGRVSVYDKFVPAGEMPSLLRRTVNPLTRATFSDVTRQLEPLLEGTDLTLESKESFLGGVYTVTVARPQGSERNPADEVAPGTT